MVTWPWTNKIPLCRRYATWHFKLRAKLYTSTRNWNQKIEFASETLFYSNVNFREPSLHELEAKKDRQMDSQVKAQYITRVISVRRWIYGLCDLVTWQLQLVLDLLKGLMQNHHNPTTGVVLTSTRQPSNAEAHLQWRHEAGVSVSGACWRSVDHVTVVGRLRFVVVVDDLHIVGARLIDAVWIQFGREQVLCAGWRQLVVVVCRPAIFHRVLFYAIITASPVISFCTHCLELAAV